MEIFRLELEQNLTKNPNKIQIISIMLFLKFPRNIGRRTELGSQLEVERERRCDYNPQSDNYREEVGAGAKQISWLRWKKGGQVGGRWCRPRSLPGAPKFLCWLFMITLTWLVEWAVFGAVEQISLLAPFWPPQSSIMKYRRPQCALCDLCSNNHRFFTRYSGPLNWGRPKCRSHFFLENFVPDDSTGWSHFVRQAFLNNSLRPFKFTDLLEIFIVVRGTCGWLLIKISTRSDGYTSRYKFPKSDIFWIIL